jgi:hypothetical protein
LPSWTRAAIVNVDTSRLRVLLRDQVPPVVRHLRLALALALAHDLNARLGHFGIGDDADQRLAVQRHFTVRDRRLFRAIGQRREQGLDRLFDLLLIDIADHDHGLPLGTVPGVVEGAQSRDRRVADDVRLADRESFGVARVVEQHRELLVADARSGTQSAAPFFDHHTPFLVDLFLRQGQPAREVGERGQPLLDHLRFVARQIEHVDGFVEARVGVHVRPESRPDRLEVRDQLARLEMGAAVERHVLDQVREPELIVGLEQRSCLDREPQRYSLRRPRVLADEVGEPVRQLRRAHGGIERNRVLKIEGLCDQYGGRRRQRENRCRERTQVAGRHMSEDRSTIIPGWTKTSRS